MAKKTEAVEKKKTLADLVFENLDLINKVEEGGEITEDLAFMLESTERALEEKMDNYVLFLKGLDKRITSLKERKAEIAAIIDQKVKNIESKKKDIKNYARTYLDKIGLESARGDLFSVTKYDSAVVESVDITLVEDQYKLYTVPEMSRAEYEIMHKTLHEKLELLRLVNDMEKSDPLEIVVDLVDKASVRVLSSKLPKGHKAIKYKTENTVTVR
jgi:hypothetical protein